MNAFISKKWLMITVFYIILIYSSLPFTVDLLNLIYNFVGREKFSLYVNIILLFFIVFIIYNLRKEIRKLILLSACLLVILLVAFEIDRPAERIHFVQYGVLGFLSMRILKTGIYKTIVFSLIIIFMVGTLDEIIQHFLPNRVGDVRDVIFNVLGGISGIWVGYFYLLYR